MRLAAVQRWPVVPNPPQIAPSIARSRFASSITMRMFLPPISRLQCLKSGAQASATSRPTELDPVKLMTGTALCRASGAPALGPSPLTKFTRSEEHTSELQSRLHLVCRLLLEKKKSTKDYQQAQATYRFTDPYEQAHHL